MKALVFLSIFLASIASLGQQGLSGKYLNLIPSTLPSYCPQGEIRFNSGSSTFEACSTANTWSSFGGGGGVWGSITGTLSSQTDLQTALNAKLTNPLTTTGDIMYSSSGTTGARLGIGSSSSVLTVVGGVPAWSAAPTPTYPISLSNGGFGVSNGSSTAAFNSISPLSTSGDILYENGSLSAARLGIGSSTNLLTVSGGLPAWEAIPTWNQNTSGSAASVSGTNVVTNSNLSTAGAYTFKGNNTASTATVGDYQSLLLGTPGFSDTGVLAQFTGSSTGYEQLIIQNTNSGSGASADVIVNNNSGTASTFYGDFGINSSNFTGSGSLQKANATYLYAESGDLVLGTNTSNAVHMLAGNSTADALQINTSNQVVVPPFSSAGAVVNNSSGVLSSTVGTAGNVLISGSPPTFSSTPTLAGIIDTSNVFNIEDSTTNSKVLAFNASNNSTSTTLTLEPTQTTSQILKFPNITAGDSVATLGLAQTFANAQTFTAAPVFSSVTASQALTVGAGKALSSNAFSTTPAASTIAEWDANKNMSFDSYIPAGTSTATAASTTALLVGSNYYQFFTGSTTQTVTLPVVTGLAQGQGFEIFNLSTGVVTVESSGTNVIQAMAANTVLKLVCINTAGGTGTASWSWMYESAQGSLPAGFSGLTTDGLIYATSGTAVASTAVGSSGSVMTSNGAGNAPTWQAAGAPTFSGLNTDGVIYATSGTAVSSTAVGSSGSVLTSNSTGSAPTFQAPITGSYAQAYFGNGSYWTLASPSGFADGVNTGGNTLTVRQHANITLTAASSSVCGIVFTPASSSAVYLITAVFAAYANLNTGAANYQLIDNNSNIIANAGIFGQGSVAGYDIANGTLSGIYVPGTSSAVTVKIQMAASTNGSAYIDATIASSYGNSVEWTVIRLY